MSRRPYEQRLRAESAAQTRRRILDSAYHRLQQVPSEALTVDRVARDASVSRSTIYLVFGGRAELFDAVGADLLQRSGFDEVMQAVEDRDARAALRRFLRATVGLYAANRDVFRNLFSMAQIDPGAAGGAISRMEHGRARGMQQLAARLAEARLLRDDMGPDDAADLLWLASSFDSFDLLATGRSRSADHIAAALTATVERTMLR
jgi:AcrR family transcriptional regulator